MPIRVYHTGSKTSNLSKAYETRDSLAVSVRRLSWFCLGCLGLSPSILSQFTLKMCVAAENRQKIH